MEQREEDRPPGTEQEGSPSEPDELLADRWNSYSQPEDHLYTGRSAESGRLTQCPPIARLAVVGRHVASSAAVALRISLRSRADLHSQELPTILEVDLVDLRSPAEAAEIKDVENEHHETTPRVRRNGNDVIKVDPRFVRPLGLVQNHLPESSLHCFLLNHDVH